MERIITRLAQHRACSKEEATILFDTFVAGGLARLIDWRCMVGVQTTQHTLTTQRIWEAIEQHRTDRLIGSDVAPDQLTKPRLKKRPSMFEPPTGKDWDMLSADEKISKLKELQQAVLGKEAEIIRLIKLRDAGSRRQLPPGVLEDTTKFFEVGERRIQQLMVDYEEYRQTYKDEPSAEFFMPLPLGRPQGQCLTEDQKSVIRFALAERSRTVRSALGKERKIDVPFEIRDVYLYAKSLCQLPSYDTVRRYIRRFQDQHPALFTLITKGEDTVERELLLKKRWMWRMSSLICRTFLN